MKVCIFLSSEEDYSKAQFGDSISHFESKCIRHFKVVVSDSPVDILLVSSDNGAIVEKIGTVSKTDAGLVFTKTDGTLFSEEELLYDYSKDISRDEFMAMYRNENTYERLTTEDRKEIFLSVLGGADDLTVELLEELFSDYDKDISEIINP